MAGSGSTRSQSQLKNPAMLTFDPVTREVAPAHMPGAAPAVGARAAPTSALPDAWARAPPRAPAYHRAAAYQHVARAAQARALLDGERVAVYGSERSADAGAIAFDAFMRAAEGVVFRKTNRHVHFLAVDADAADALAAVAEAYPQLHLNDVRDAPSAADALDVTHAGVAAVRGASVTVYVADVYRSAISSGNAHMRDQLSNAGCAVAARGVASYYTYALEHGAAMDALGTLTGVLAAGASRLATIAVAHMAAAAVCVAGKCGCMQRTRRSAPAPPLLLRAATPFGGPM